MITHRICNNVEMLVMSWGKSAHMFWIKDGDKQDWKKTSRLLYGL